MAEPQKIEKKLSRVFRMPEIGTRDAVLTAAEIDFFRLNGFLVKKGLIDRSLCSKALDRVWRYVLDYVVDSNRHTLDPHGPTTWINPVWQPQQKADTEGFYEGRPPIVASGSTLKLHDVGRADFLVDLLPRNKNVRNVAQLLLSKNLRASTCTRGVYALFPRSDTIDVNEAELSTKQLGPHSDRVCQQLNVCTYLEDVEPRSGAFTVYPGSHRIMYRAHRYDANWSPTESFRNLMAQVVNTIEPCELVAQRGDVIFWHGRTVHTGGIHVTNRIRWAVFGDLCIDRPTQSDDEHRQVGQYEWFKDTKLFKEDDPIFEDMWHNWQMGGGA